MPEEKQRLNIFQKLAKIRKQVEVIKKNRSGFNYKYVTDDEILAKVTAFMDKYSISLVPVILQGTLKYDPYHYLKTKFDKKINQYYEEHNNEVIVSADMVFSWINNDDPTERVDVPWIMIGQQADSSQAFGSGLTYSMRYFLLKYFNIATPEDDVDNWRSKQRAAEAAEERAVLEEIIKQIDEVIINYLAKKPNEGEKIKKLVSEYVQDGDYFSITESALAIKLLTELQEQIA